MEEINSINDRIDNIITGVNIFFVLINCIIIFLMQTGFAFLEAGSVRAKNTTHILIKNILDTATACVVYWATGYAFTAGSDNNPFIGTNKFFLINSDAIVYTDFFYNLVYATASGTIVAGALAERSVIWGYLIYSMAMTGFIYPVVAHWIFTPVGWLNDIGFHDKSGSCVIHVVGGVAAFVGSVILGPRIGRFGKGGKVNSIPGHSTVLSTLGFFILWFGFLSFNGVSEKGIVGSDFNYEVPPRAVVNTVLGGTGALLSSILITKIGISKMEIKIFKKEFKVINVFGGYWSVGASINGSLAGSVAVCAGCDVLDPWAGFVVGVISGAIYCIYARLILLIRVDDPVNAFPLHFGGGSWGTAAVALFAHPNRLPDWPNGGILYAWDRDSFAFLGIQLMGVAIVTLWVGVLATILFACLRLVGLLRAGKDEETDGLDFVNGEPAYPIDAALLAFGKNSEDDDIDDEDDPPE